MIGYIHIDPIHGKFELPEYVQNIINTEEFQRLRNLRQLGLSYWMFPGAIHTRYEHCIGVYHLTDVLVDYIRLNSKLADINEFFVNCVKVAGLLHDVGHGPFSHLWDQVAGKVGKSLWSHEEMSCKITKSIFTKYNIRISDDLADNKLAPELISAFIVGDREKLMPILGPKYMFLSEIVNNTFCEIDVDKWDYIVRDSYFLRNAIELPLDFDVCFKGALITYDKDNVSHISYHRQDEKHIYQLFVNRKELHVNVYQDPSVAIVEEMVVDALEAAEKAGFLFMGLKLTDAYTDLNVFNHIDDSILKIIETSSDTNLAEARNILRRIKTRTWYKFKTYNDGDAINGHAEGSLVRDQYISAAHKKMPNTIIFHGTDDAQNGLIPMKNENDNDVRRKIVYTPA